MHRLIKTRLMVMMFLQFFIWGAWYATGGNYMRQPGHDRRDLPRLHGEPHRIDRRAVLPRDDRGPVLPVQKVLGIHARAERCVRVPRAVRGGKPFDDALPRRSSCSTCSATCRRWGWRWRRRFISLPNKEREFPRVRHVRNHRLDRRRDHRQPSLLQGDTTALPMYISGVGGLLMGVYALTLPNVPPRRRRQEVLGARHRRPRRAQGAELAPVHRRSS